MNVRALTTWGVWRPQTGPDGSGGQTAPLSLVGDERGDVRELAGRELIEARQAGAEHTHSGWFRLRADIRRGDELRRGEMRLEVEAVSPSFPATRLRVIARSIEAGE